MWPLRVYFFLRHAAMCHNHNKILSQRLKMPKNITIFNWVPSLSVCPPGIEFTEIHMTEIAASDKIDTLVPQL